MAGDPPDDNGADWRRLASDRNVSGGVARALWEQARTASPDDPAHAERMYELMLDEAAAANVTHEPGRETLAGSTAGRDAAGVGPGKFTRVLLEQPAPAAGRAGKKLTADDIRNELASAGKAGLSALAGIAAADPATLVETLRELQSRPLPGPLQKVLGVAGDLVERALAQRDAGAKPTASGTTADAAKPATATPTTVDAAKPATATPTAPDAARPAASSAASSGAARGAASSASPSTPATPSTGRRR